jgi:hypothetical protein
VLQSGRGIVDRIDALTRLNRQRGVGQVMVSHTMSDLLALPAAEDRMKAKGFVERSGMVICGGLARSEMDQLTEVVRLTEAEIETISGWQDPAAWSANGRPACRRPHGSRCCGTGSSRCTTCGSPRSLGHHPCCGHP